MTTEEKKRTYKQTIALVKKMQKKLSTPPETGMEWEKTFDLCFLGVGNVDWEKVRLFIKEQVIPSALAQGEKMGREKERARLSGWLMHDDNCKGLYFDPKKTNKCDCGLDDALKGTL